MSNTGNQQEVLFNPVNFPLNKIENQDEYDVTLEIHNNDGEVTSYLKTKIRFIWSYFKFSQELLGKSEHDKTNYEAQLDKCNNFLNTLMSKIILKS